MKSHIKICIQIEQTAGRIYRKMLESPRLGTNARRTLSQLAEDEDKHAGQLDFALRFPEDSVVTSLPKLKTTAQQLLALALEYLEDPGLAQVADQQAVDIGIQLEKKLCQVHIANAFEFKEQNMKKMFAAMAEGDELHCQRLYDLQRTLHAAG